MGKAVNGGLHMYTMYVDRTRDGWGEVKDPGDIFNPDKTMHISASLNGTIYTTDISGGLTSNVNGVISEAGRECLGMIRIVNNEYQKIEQLGPPLNAMKQSQHPWISPDESYMLFSVRRPGQEIESALFYANRNSDGKWSEPTEINLGIDVSQPFITYDGKYLFFTSGDQKCDIYWVSTKIIRELKPKE